MCYIYFEVLSRAQTQNQKSNPIITTMRLSFLVLNTAFCGALWNHSAQAADNTRHIPTGEHEAIAGFLPLTDVRDQVSQCLLLQVKVDRRLTPLLL